MEKQTDVFPFNCHLACTAPRTCNGFNFLPEDRFPAWSCFGVLMRYTSLAIVNLKLNADTPVVCVWNLFLLSVSGWVAIYAIMSAFMCLRFESVESIYGLWLGLNVDNRMFFKALVGKCLEYDTNCNWYFR